MTIAEIVAHIDDDDDAEEIYVESGTRLVPSTPAAVTGEAFSADEPVRDLGFRHLSDVNDAREVIWSFGDVSDESSLQQLLETIEEFGM